MDQISDQTIWDESNSESTFDFYSFSKESKEFENISKENIQALHDIEREIVNSELLNQKKQTHEYMNNLEKNEIPKIKACRELAKEQQMHVKDIMEEEQEISKNIVKLKTRFESAQKALPPCLEEKKALRKEYKSNKTLINLVIDYYKQHFGIRMDIEDKTREDSSVSLYFSKQQNVKPVKLSYNASRSKIELLPSDCLTHDQILILQECLNDEKQIVPAFCALRDIVLDKLR